MEGKTHALSGGSCPGGLRVKSDLEIADSRAGRRGNGEGANMRGGNNGRVPTPPRVIPPGPPRDILRSPSLPHIQIIIQQKRCHVDGRYRSLARTCNRIRHP